MPRIVERMQDYVYTIASIAAGATITDDIVMDADAPFCLRSLAFSVEAGVSQLGTLRYADYNDDWVQSEGVLLGGTSSIMGLVPVQGTLGPQPVYPQEIYPAQGVIRFRFTNTGTGALTNLRLYFRGVKLFEEGSVLAPGYPPCWSSRKYDYSITNIGLTPTQTLTNLMIQIENDGDIAFRAGAVSEDSSAAGVYTNLYARLRDQNGNYFQSDWMHVNVLFSHHFPERPQLFYPEIYVPRNGTLFFDLMRNDGGGANCTTNFDLQGAKIYRV